ncbi:MAG TPA: HupE/UreJ family protein [Humisphaera sp.]
MSRRATPCSRFAPRAIATALVTICAVWFGAPAAAHPEGFSGLRVVVEPGAVRLEATIHTRDLDRWFPPRSFPDYVVGVCRGFEREAPDLYAVEIDGSAASPRNARAFLLEPGLIQIDLDYGAPAAPRNLSVEFLRFAKLPRGHAQYVTVDDARRPPPPGGKPRTLLHDRIDADSPASALDLPPPPPAATTGPATAPAAGPAADAEPPPPEVRINFFTDGVRHILGGYDHLLFVAALLLACRTFREATTIITFFTVAHSVTLGLSAMNLVRIDGRLIEVGIAATIVFVAVENLVRRPPLAWRCGLTTFFGLIHGLGFARDVKEKLASDRFADIVGPLVKFSAGVETGHLTLVFLALPLLLWAKRRTPTFDRVAAPGLSLVIAGFGAFWLVGRLLWE